MTPQDIITDARYLLQDTDTLSPRHANAELLLYVNDGLREMVGLQPLLFSTIGDLICTPGTCEQAITFANAVSLIEVLCHHEGPSLTVFDLMAMNAYNPNWRTDTAGAARQWCRFANDPLKFYIYPKAPGSSQSLDIRYVRNPTTYTIDASITDVPLVYQSALADYVVYRAQMKDDEHVLSQRAGASYQSFMSKVKGA